MPVDYGMLVAAARQIIHAIGEDPDRDGLADTPRRFADWWQEFIDYDAGFIETSFQSVSTDQMVVVSGMRVWSLCEHHLMPFWCDIAIGYIANDKILGLSKFARIAKMHAHKSQVQERLVHEIADHVSEICGTGDVAVEAGGEHLCMTARGVKMRATMTTSVMRGAFLNNASARQEFFHLMSNGR